MEFETNKTVKVKQKNILSYFKKIPPPTTDQMENSKMENNLLTFAEQRDLNRFAETFGEEELDLTTTEFPKKRSRIAAGSDDEGTFDVSATSSVLNLQNSSQLTTDGGDEESSGFRDEAHTSSKTSTEQPSGQRNGAIHSPKTDQTMDDEGEEELPNKSSKMTSFSLKRIPKCSGSLPPLKSTSQHTVLFDQPGCRKETDKWDDNHVKLPCSPHNKISKNGNRSFWETLHYTLTFSPISSAKDLEERVMTYRGQSTMQLRGLHDYFRTCTKQYVQEFFTSTLPKIVELALLLPSLITTPIPLLRCGMNHKITMTHQQAASLMSNAFLCTYPRHLKDFNFINFTNLLCSSAKSEGRRQKLKTFLHYFDRIAKDGVSDGNLTFERRSLKPDEVPAWSENTKTFQNMMLVDHKGKIEQEGYGMLQVDFANKYIGGGALGNGLVQEEIRFAICPELVVSMLLCEKMNDNEAIIMTGAEQFSDYDGYAHTYMWSGSFHDLTEQDEWRRITTQIVAIDALPFHTPRSSRKKYKHFRGCAVRDQFKMNNVRRELKKAYCGFHHGGESAENLPAIATGNWGCGAFGGDPILKAVIQLMAASSLDRQLGYFTWKDLHLRNKLERLYQMMQSPLINVGTMWRLLVEYSTVDASEEDFYSFLLDSLTTLNYDD